MREFKVGDKVYFPYYGTDIFEVKSNEFNENLEKYPLMIGSKTFTIHGKMFDQSCLQDIFHATPENNELLNKLYDCYFAIAPNPTMAEKIIMAHIEKQGYAVCFVSDFDDVMLDDDKRCSIITAVEFDDGDGSSYFTSNIDSETYFYAVPIDPVTGKEITELPT